MSGSVADLNLNKFREFFNYLFAKMSELNLEDSVRSQVPKISF